MYKSLTKTKNTQSLKHMKNWSTLKEWLQQNAILKHYKSSSLITVKRHAMVLSFFKGKPCQRHNNTIIICILFDSYECMFPL